MPGAEGATTFQTSADAYDRHVGRYGPQLARALIDAAGVATGQRALDVGCGPGVLAHALAVLLGDGSVAAVDPSEPFAQACRARNPGVDVRTGAAEELPFSDAQFDAALAQLVINFLTDARRGVGEMRRVTRPGGVVAAAVWDYAGEMTLLRSFWDAAVALEPRRAGDRDEGRIMRYARPDELYDLWTSVGLEEVRLSELIVSAEYSDYDDLWLPFAAGVAPSGAYAASLDADRREALRVEFHRRLGSPGGPFHLDARAWCAVGVVPHN